MKVAIIGVKGYPYVYGGFDTFVKELSERLVKKDVQVTIYCHKALFNERPKQVNGINLVYIPSIESKSLSQITHSFFSFLHLVFNKPDVVFVVNSANGPFGLITKIARIPSIINVDGLEWLRPKWKGFGAKYFFWASKMATKLYDHIVNDAEEMRKVYLELFNIDSTVIAYGADPAFSTQPELINTWGLEKDSYYVIVGRLIPDNNSDIIIEGFLSSSSDKKLVIVGDVPYKDEYANKLKTLAKHDDRLIFTGLVKDRAAVAELFLNSYCYFHGHQFGGTNPTMLEALSFGCSILALDTPFNREVLAEGKFGLFFTKNAQEIKELVERMDCNKAFVDRQKENSRKRLENATYNWDSITDEYIKLFRLYAKSND